MNKKHHTLYRHFVAPGGMGGIPSAPPVMRGQVAGCVLTRSGSDFLIAVSALHDIIPAPGDELHDDEGKKWRVGTVAREGENYKLTCQELT